nr:outer membrane protein porin [Tanacetum cinerariifolium]
MVKRLYKLLVHDLVLDTQDNSEKDLILNLQTQVKESELLEIVEQMKSQVSELVEKLQILDQEMKQQIILFEEDKRMFLAKNEFLDKVSSSVQKEYNDSLASNDVLKQRLETKFKFLKHNHSLEKMFEMIDQEYESNVSKISITSSTIETKNLELVKEMRDKVKRSDDEKKIFENKISKLEKDLVQRVKDFDDVKTELSKRTDKFETYFANLEKENALLKSQLASQNYTSLQKENNDLRTSYNVLKEEYEISYAKVEKENNDLKMHYKRLFDSIKQKKVASRVFTKSIPKVNVSDKIYTGESSKPISKKVSQVTTYSLQKDRNDEDESKVMVSKSDNVQHKPEQANQPRKMVQKPLLKNVEKGTGQREVRPVWNNTMRINHKNFSNSKRNFAPTAVLTKSGIVQISTARQSSSRAAAPVSVARTINTAAPKPLVNVAKPKQNAL